MKKILGTICTLILMVTVTACTSSTGKKAIEQSKLSMASADYTAALNYLQLAQQEGADDDEVKELITIIENYIKAKEEFDKLNMDGASEALNAIPTAYKKYSIAKDVDSIQQQISEKKAVMGDVDSQISAVKKWIASGDYESASANITELYSKDITNYQRKQIDELKQTLDSAQSKIKAEANKNAAKTSSNTSVVATYYVVNCKESITLRSTPSTSASEIVQIPLGQAVGYIENAGNGFYKINYDGQVGYGLASYLSPEKYNTSSGRLAQIANCNEWVTLRNTPSTSGAELTRISLGDYVTYLNSAENGFCYVEYNGQKGYVLQAYVQLR